MIFLSDLDNTLIFSYKKMSPDNLCVETKEGKKLSYMTHEGGRLFREMTEKMRFIPITTRSVEQYSRIIFPG
ncbi:MAG: HAD family hydrolase, partial [Oscillospiraceae bacterium]|nr:HAD family hydrolase [Oscillospiraceae bacterium]